MKFPSKGKGGKGIPCKSDPDGDAPCGIPNKIWHWDNQTMVPANLMPSGKADYFYPYDPLPYDDGDAAGYFGYKVLAVSFGGTLRLSGVNGATQDDQENSPDPLKSGTSWLRLNGTLEPGKASATQLVLDISQTSGGVKWRNGDRIVATTTDYLPAHSEKLIVVGDVTDGKTVTFRRADSDGTLCTPKPSVNPAACGVRWRHQGEQFPIRGARRASGKLPVPANIGPDGATAVETRAAVALLTRNVRIVSGGLQAGDPFPPAATKYRFGGHVIARQGFEEFKLQGVEFKQLGQGGKLAHYPVHFHMARKVADGTYVKDSSVNESMTRWFVIHGTEGVLLARNVGYQSIGHGYYLEDGSEVNNRLYSNIGIFARAGVVVPDGKKTRPGDPDPNNPREVPGILAAADKPPPGNESTNYLERFPFHTDFDHPSVFWLMNGWNDLQGNLAAGAGTCGACYWFPPGQNSGPSGYDYKTYLDPNGCNIDPKVKWTGYASLQQCSKNAGGSPIKTFSGNYCTSAMLSLVTVADVGSCAGISAPGANANFFANLFQAVPNKLAPSNLDKYSKEADDPKELWGKLKSKDAYDYFPLVTGDKRATLLPNETQDSRQRKPCSGVETVNTTTGVGNCTVNVINRYISSFNWAETNVSALWLRNTFFLVQNSVLTDVQNGGLTFVTSGDYTLSAAMEGYWSIARKSAFIGTTQPDNPYAENDGPLNGGQEGGRCQNKPPADGNACIDFTQQIAMPLTNFAANQRFFNIYDGPSYQTRNAYLDITPTTCNKNDNSCKQKMYLRVAGGVHKQWQKQSGKLWDGTCFLPNAAIAWKQPNGFFYPPAFHSSFLFFDNVPIRHFVIEPLFYEGTYRTDWSKVDDQYCFRNPPPAPGAPAILGLFQNWSDVDRQTVLNDNDGSLTGLLDTISVNEDAYFNAPLEVPECASNVGVTPGSACPDKPGAGEKTPATARTSPYEYVTTVVYPGVKDADWSKDCTAPNCFGVPLYRQYLTEKEAERWTQNQCDRDKDKVPDVPECRWPFIRMAGTATGQRSTLTANHGTYYIDTAVTEATQRENSWDPTNPNCDKDKGHDPFNPNTGKDCPCGPYGPYTTNCPGWLDPNMGSNPGKFVNVFEPDHTYHVYFVFATPGIRQTYQIYVGPDFLKGRTISDLVKFERADISTADVDFLPAGEWPKSWASSGQTAPVYNPKTGVLTVTVDFTEFSTLLDPKNKANGLCKPSDFCEWQGTACGAKTDPITPFPKDISAAERNRICKTWAVKDVVCPVYHDPIGDRDVPGCLGFSVKFPNVVADGNPHRPQPVRFAGAGTRDHLYYYGTDFRIPPANPLYPNIPGKQCTYAASDLPGTQAAAGCKPH